MPKLILLSINMVCTIFVLGILKGTKDALLITELGAEVLSTMKVYGVLPFAVLFTLSYTWLSNLFSQATLYNLLNWVFISYFILFSFLLYPNNMYFRLDLSKTMLLYPFLIYQLLMISNWSYALFYILSEMWGNVMLALMLWQIANEAFTIVEAKKYYPLLTLAGEVGTMLSGIVLFYIAYDKHNNFASVLQVLSIPVLLAGLIISINIYLLSKYFINKNGCNVSKKTKLTLIQSFRIIFSSKYIALITVIVVCYGVCITLTESLWQKYVGLLYTRSLEYCSFMGKVQIYLSCATILAILCSFIIISKLAWKASALVTPMIMLFAGSIFFLVTIFQDYLSEMMGRVSILSFCVLFGAALDIIIKASRYSFFEPTKEMLYISLASELKSKGKCVADVLGERTGKAFAAFTQTTMLSLIVGSTIISMAPFLFLVFLTSIVSWLAAINALSKICKA